MAGESEGFGDRLIVLIEIAAEVGGVIGVEGDEQAAFEPFGERVVGDGVDAAAAGVGEGADGERDAVATGDRHRDLRVCVGSIVDFDGLVAARLLRQGECFMGDPML